MRRICAIFSVFLLLGLPVKAQWSFNQQDSTLHYFCPECPDECRDLVFNPIQQTLTIGDATEVDIIYTDSYGHTWRASEGVDVKHLGEEENAALVVFIAEAYGWLEMTVYTRTGTYTYILPTPRMWELEKMRMY